MYILIDLEIINSSFYEAIQNKKLNVFKYDYNAVKGKVKKKNKQKEQDFESNLLRISYATARTLCSFHIDNKELYFDIIASILSHLNFVEPNDSRQSFLLKKDRLNRLRDFSQTSRTGEMAQGINYLFVQERLDYPYIIDYHLFCDRLNIKIEGRTPDFVLLNPLLNKIGLFESKSEASVANSVTTKLNDAMKQLMIGKQNLLLNKKLYAKNLYPVCTKFLFEHPEISTINYCYIAFSDEPVKFSPDDIIKAHYASWFYLVGDFTRAQLLSNGENIPSLEDVGEVTYDGVTDKDIYWVSNINNAFFNSVNKHLLFVFMKSYFKIGIRKDVVKRLTITIEGPMPTQEAIIDGEMQWFTDGTVLRIKTKG
jgi:hypothetical protein